MTQSRPAESHATWLGLDVLPDGHALRLFRDGLEALVEERYDDARRALQAGLSSKDISDDLGRDMQNLLARIPESGQNSVVANGEGTGHVWLNAYQNSDQPE